MHIPGILYTLMQVKGRGEERRGVEVSDVENQRYSKNHIAGGENKMYNPNRKKIYAKHNINDTK